MAAYAYKKVLHRIPEHIEAQIEDYEGGANYDGDGWDAASMWIDELLAENARLASNLAELTEQTRVRDARVEPPPRLPDDTNWVLVWIDGLWEPSFWETWSGDSGWHIGNDTVPASCAPHWLPMPPAPKVDHA